VIQWSFLAVCLFYLTGHWCTFDGLRYGAAFIGFDHFHIIRQGLLLSIDTFGVSHILPILSLPFIAMVWYNTTSKDDGLKDVILNNVTQVLYIWLLVQSRKTVYVLKEVWGTNSRNEGVRNPLCECAYWCEFWITEQLNKEKLHWRSPIFTVYSKSIFMHPCNFPYGSIPAVWCFDHIAPNRLTYFFFVKPRCFWCMVLLQQSLLQWQSYALLFKGGT